MLWQAILAVILSFVIGELIKTALQLTHKEQVSVFTLGGMPSTHTSSVTALIIAVWLETGVSLSLLITVVFSIIVIRDAYGLRWEVTQHSQALNKLLKQRTFIRVGHKQLEVLAGIVLGIVVTLAVYLVF